MLTNETSRDEQNEINFANIFPVILYLTDCPSSTAHTVCGYPRSEHK